MFPPRYSHRKATDAPTRKCEPPSPVGVKPSVFSDQLKGSRLLSAESLKKMVVAEWIFVPAMREKYLTGESKIKVAKHSPVSTGRLRRLPALHLQPINLVVFQGASGRWSNET